MHGEMWIALLLGFFVCIIQGNAFTKNVELYQDGKYCGSVDISVSHVETPIISVPLENVHNLSPKYGYFVQVANSEGVQDAACGTLQFPFDTRKLPKDKTPQDAQVFWLNENDSDGPAWYALPTIGIEGSIITIKWANNLKGIFMIGAFDDYADAKEARDGPPTSTTGNAGGGSPGDTESSVTGINALPDIVQSANAEIADVIPVLGGNSGDAMFSFPIDTPTGRRGIEPDITLTYVSSSTDSWLGEGWMLNGVPSITIDTTFGVPFASGDEVKYIFNGEKLAQQGATPGGGTVFTKRQEHSFFRITRHGTGDDSYTWAVTDQHGTTSYYGARSDGVLSPLCSLRAHSDNKAGNIIMWGLCEQRDLYGNYMTVDWAFTQSIFGSVNTTDLYPSSIKYTGWNTQDGQYKVNFVRGGDVRENYAIECRKRWCTGSNDLLTSVEVYYKTELIRSYGLKYKNGQFGVKLLANISEYSGLGNKLYTNTFNYYDEISSSPCKKVFCPPEAWSIPADTLYGGIDISALADADIEDYVNLNIGSAISSTVSTGVGYHIYVGVAFDPYKEGSAGVGHGDVISETAGLIDLIDIDGDRLPDKVYMNGTHGVYYRPQIRGQNAFGAATPVNGLEHVLSFYAETGWVDTTGVEAYFGISGFVSGSFGFSFTTNYWDDVNGDGFVDLVDTGTVYYNHLEKGVPTFVPGDSTDTVFPLGFGGEKPDTGNSTDSVQSQIDQSFRTSTQVDMITKWTVPFTGMINITSHFVVLNITEAITKSIRVAVQVNNEADKNFTFTNVGDSYPYTDSFPVNAGDSVYVRMGANQDGAGGIVSVTPTIQYTNFATNAVDVNGLSIVNYNLLTDMSVWGLPATTTTTVYNGSCSVHTFFRKTGNTTDDVTLNILYDNVVMASVTLHSDEIGDFILPNSLSVYANHSVNVTLSVDSPIDLSKIEVTAAPLLVYDPSETKKANSTIGYNIDIYSLTFGTTPLLSWTAPKAGTYSINPKISSSTAFDMVLTVKSQGQLVLKESMRSDAPKKLSYTFDGTTAYYIEASTRVPLNKNSISAVSADILYPNGSHAYTAPMGLNYAYSGFFSLPVRGWSYAGYNSTHCQELKLNETAFSAQPETKNNGSNGQPAFSAYPSLSPLGWLSSGSTSIITPTTMSNTHLGAEYRSLTKLTSQMSKRVQKRDDVLRGFPKIGTTLFATAGGGPPFASISKAKGTTLGTVGTMDMNGDQFPDIITIGGFVQHTKPDGTLRKIGHMDYFNMEETDVTSTNLGVGGSPAGFLGNGKGEVSSSGQSIGRGGTSRSQTPNFGVNAGYDHCDSDQSTAFIDINGDGLTDSCSSHDGVVECRISTGYEFVGSITYNTSDINKGTQQGGFLGVTGFSDGIGGYGGGLSFSLSENYPTNTLIDVNGDGRPDAVSMSGNKLMVGINMGTYFAPAVNWGTINGTGFIVREDLSVNIGGFVTIPILVWPLPPIFIITNPEVFTQAQLGKQTHDLRDMNGDSFTDLAYSVADGDLRVSLNHIGRTNLLQSVEGPIGGKYTVFYERAGNTAQDPMNHWVLSKITEDDGIQENGNATTTTFQYEDGVWDFGERVFRGFGTVTQSTEDCQGNTYRSRISTFATDSFYRVGLLTDEKVVDAKSGQLFNEYSFNYTLTQQGSASYFAQLNDDNILYYEGTPSASMVTKNTYEYNSFGQIVIKRIYGDVRFETDDIVETTSYSSMYTECVNNYLVGIPVTLTQLSFHTGKLLTSTDNIIDCTNGAIDSIAKLTGNQTSQYTNITYYPNGNLLATLNSPNYKGQVYYMNYTYDSDVNIFPVFKTDAYGYSASVTFDYRFGVQLTTTDVNGQVSRFYYDEFGRIIAIQLPPEQGTSHNSSYYTYQTDYLPVYCITSLIDVTSVATNPYHDVITFLDGLGRVIQAKRRGILYNQAADATSEVLFTSGWIVFDDYGRVSNSYDIAIESTDAFTQLLRTYSTIPPTHTSYDIMDRTVRTDYPDGNYSTTSYGFGYNRDNQTNFMAISVDQNNYRSDSFSNIYGVTTARKNYLFATVIWRSAEVDELNRVVQTTDDYGNIYTKSYDFISRTVADSSPDTGIIKYRFDTAGNLISEVTSNLQDFNAEIKFEYDYNQLLKVSYPLFPQNDVEYTWGDHTMANSNRVGKIYKVEVADGSYSQENGFDNFGRVSYVNKTVVAMFGPNNEYNNVMTYNMSFSYDTWDRMITRTYGDGEVVHYVYNTGGTLESVYGQTGGAAPTYYVNFVGYNEHRWKSMIKWANNVNQSLKYDPKMVDRVVQKILTMPLQVVENVHYFYDASGVVVTINSDVPLSSPATRTNGGPFTLTITRDPLYRIVSMNGTYHLSSISWQDFFTDFTYDNIHNLKNKHQQVNIHTLSSSSPNPLLTYNVSYTYNSGRPHKPSEVTQNFPGSFQKFCFLYDDNGNTVTVITHNMDSTTPAYEQALWESLCADYFHNTTNSTFLKQVLAYDEQDRLQSIYGDNFHQLYQYNHEKYRTVKNADNNGLVVYLDRTYQVKDGRPSKYYFAGGMLVAGKDGSNGASETCLQHLPVHSPTCQYFFHTSNVATNWVADMFGKPIAYFTYLIEGEPWIQTVIDSSQAPASTHNLPVRPDGNEMDESGYEYCGDAVYYNPALHLNL